MNYQRIKLNIKKPQLILAGIIILAACLRLLWLNKVPTSLYSDELAQGYNAYSILKTGRDEFGSLFPVTFRSFGEWKPSLSVYLSIPGIFIFGLNEMGLRIVPAILNTFAVLVVYFLTDEIFKEYRYRRKLALLAAFFLGVSPWHILHSRALLFEAQGLLFLMIGILFFLRGLSFPKWWVISGIGFVLSLYAYHSLRIVTPLLVVFLMFKYFPRLRINLRYFLGAFLISGVLLMPLILGSLKNSAAVFGRARYVSIFYDRDVILRIWKDQTEDGLMESFSLTNFLHNKPYYYFLSATRNYLVHFDGSFLFLKGDDKKPFPIPGMGLVYLLDFPFLIYGFYRLWRDRINNRGLLTFWFLISPIPAAFTFLVPSSNRILNLLPPLLIVNAYGLISMIDRFGKRIAVYATIGYLICIGYFARQYFLELPLHFAGYWHYGGKQIVIEVNKLKTGEQKVVVSNALGVPYIFFVFYNRYDPGLFQKNARYTRYIDQLGFEHVDGFGDYEFPREFNWKEEKAHLRKNTIYVVGSAEAKDDDWQKAIVLYPDGREAFKIFSVN